MFLGNEVAYGLDRTDKVQMVQHRLGHELLYYIIFIFMSDVCII